MALSGWRSLEKFCRGEWDAGCRTLLPEALACRTSNNHRNTHIANCNNSRAGELSQFLSLAGLRTIRFPADGPSPRGF
jgi:hypothetical protein